ncbi:MAG: hypothetical protein WAM11_05610 [Cyanobium sp.]
MIPLLTAVVLTVAVLMGLWGVILGGWWLVLWLIDPLLERSRASVRHERILLSLQAWERQRQLQAQERSRQRLQVVDLDGQTQWMMPEELAAFHRRCWAELELGAGSPWLLVRQQWRRRSLRWHPDHGGDPATWLRKQRAYEALKGAASLARRFNPAAPGPRRIGARQRPWPWRRG